MENKPNLPNQQQQPGKPGGTEEKRPGQQDPNKQGEGWRQGQGGSSPGPGRNPQMPNEPARKGGGQQQP